MLFDTKWIDVNGNLQSQQQPVFFLERALLHGDKAKGGIFNVAEVARKGDYWTASSPLPTEIDWSNTKTGDHVRVPVFAYRTTQKAITALVGTGIQHGIAAMHSLRKRTIADVERCVLILGHEVHDVGDAYRFYLGITFELKENR